MNVRLYILQRATAVLMAPLLLIHLGVIFYASSQGLSAAGIPADEARSLTIVFLAALEGAFVLCRATKTTEALEVAGEQMTAMVREALG